MASNEDPIPAVSNDAIGSPSGIASGGASATRTAAMTMMAPPGRRSAADLVEGAMLRLVPDLQARAEVEEALREMVLDVEIAHSLQEQASKHLVIQRLREDIEQHKRMLDERTMLDVERREAEGRLADQLVRELWVLSEELGQLKKVKARHKELLMQHDEVVAQLLQAQEELADARDHRATATATATATANSPTAAAAAAAVASAPSQQGRGDGGGLPPAVDRVPSSSSPPAATQAAPPTKPDPPKRQKDVTDEQPESPRAPEVAPQAEPQLVSPPGNDVRPPPERAVPEENVTASPPMGSVHGNEAAIVPGASPAAPVVVLEEEQEPDAPKLEEFEESILMLVFSFLDALDILNTAQVNISMYSRVDTLFFGSGHDPGADDSTIGTNEATASSATDRSVPTTAASSTAASSSQPPSTPKASSSSAAGAAKSPPPPLSTPSSSVAASAAHSPTVVRLPPPDSSSSKLASAAATPGPAATITTRTTTTTSSGPPALSPLPPPASTPAAASPSRAAAASGLSLFSSILQPRLPGSAASAAAPKPSAVPTGTIVAASGSTSTSGLLVPHRRSASVDATLSSSSQQQQQQPMNAAMANSMASKLSDAELNAIIVMTERLKSREQVADKLRRENDELRAKLDGADALREYLIGKVRDMEKSLSSTEEQDAKTALQIASDQEVIAFLDARVQELEAEGRTRSKDLEESNRQRERLTSESDQKVKVLSDMLQFERERVKENEVEWKATRKVLVKEVKNLRAQMAALVAERDGYREQNEQLRRAVVTSFSNSASPSRLRQGSFS